MRESYVCVEIPESVTRIGDGALGDCSKLAKIDVAPESKSYASVDGVLFSKDKKRLICYPVGKSDEYYEVPEGTVSIEGGAFEGCVSLKVVKLPEGVTSIGYGAFSGCKNLALIKIPESVTDISFDVFNGCTSLVDKNGFIIVRGVLFDYTGEAKAVVIPSGVKSIGCYAFAWCESLTSVKIPESVTRIGDRAFGDCSKLAKIDVAPESKSYTSVDGVLFSKDKNCLVCYPVGKSDEYYEVPEGTVSIEGGAFEGCVRVFALSQFPRASRASGGGVHQLRQPRHRYLWRHGRVVC